MVLYLHSINIKNLRINIKNLPINIKSLPINIKNLRGVSIRYLAEVVLVLITYLKTITANYESLFALPSINN